MLVFAVLLGGTAGLGLFANARLQAVSAAASDVRNNWLPATRALGDMAAAAERIRLNQTLMLEDRTSEERESRSVILKQRKAEFEDAVQRYKHAKLEGAEGKDSSNYVMSAWYLYEALVTKYVDLLHQGKRDEALSFANGSMQDGMKILPSSLARATDLQVKESTRSIDAGAELEASTRKLIAIAIGVVVVLSLAAAWSLIQGLERPIGRLTASMRRLADRDMSVHIPCLGRGDEIGGMAGAVEVFKTKMLQADSARGWRPMRCPADRADQRTRAVPRASGKTAAEQQAFVVERLAAGLRQPCRRGPDLCTMQDAFAPDYEGLACGFQCDRHANYAR